MGGRTSKFNCSGMKRSYTLMDSHNKPTGSAKRHELRRANTEPQRGKLSKEEKRRVNYGDPHNDEHGSRFLRMQLSDKRHLYKCGGNFKKEVDLALWPVVWKMGKSHLKVKGKIPKSQVIYPVNDVLNKKISIEQGDITKLEVDAVVNAANTSLLGGGGVDGAIHRAAGPTLYKECVHLNGCNTGDAKITSGHCLPAKYIIHTVGPVGKHPGYLRNCYLNSLNMALKFDIESIAFPCISTGVYGYPSEDAAHVALEAVRKWLDLEDHAEKIRKIIFCSFLKKDWDIYTQYLQFYFPCEEIQQECSDKSHSEASEIKVGVEVSEEEESESAEQIEREVKDIDNIPSVDMSDILSEESNSSTDMGKRGPEEENKAEGTQAVDEGHEGRIHGVEIPKDVLEQPTSDKAQSSQSHEIEEASEVQEAPSESTIEDVRPEGIRDENIENRSIDISTGTLEDKELTDVGEHNCKKERKQDRTDDKKDEGAVNVQNVENKEGQGEKGNESQK